MVIQIDNTDIERIAAAVCSMLVSGGATGKQTASPIMDVDELSVMLKVQPSWVYKQIQFKSIPHFHAGKYPRFKRHEIDEWIQEQSIPCTTAPYPKLKKC